MKKPLAILLSLALPAVTFGAEAANPYLSLQLEIKHAIKRGNAFLKSKQVDGTHWGDPSIPALSALPLTAAMGDPNLDPKDKIPAYIDDSYAWLLSMQKDDGGIYGKGLASYNSSAAVMALLARGRKADEPALLKARAFLINQQTDWGVKGETDDKFDGGVGYGASYAHSDLSNTYLALEALAKSRHVAKDGEHGKQPELDWKAALQFVSRYQNLEETND